MSRTTLLIGTVAGLALAACHENLTETVSDPPRPSFSVAQSKSSPVVNSTTDDGDGTCTVTKCTLRDAIAHADPGATITFAASLTAGGPATISLTAAIPSFFEQSGLLIAKNLTITGPGADKLTVTRPSDGEAFRIFRISAGTVSISGLAITNGRAPGGGGIRNQATLALADCVVSGNTAHFISSYTGGGIDNFGTMTLDRCTVSDNSAVEGGAVMNKGTLIITNSTVSGNNAYSVAGISNYDGGPLTIAHSTISNNSSAVNGSAIDGPATVRNSIFAGNRRNQTLDPASNCSQRAGGVITDGGYNIDDGASCGFTGTGSLQNTDPKLVAAGITNNGGPTATIALDPTSPAINSIAAGTNGCGSTYTTDQRGFVRPAGTRCDIGAFEYGAALDASGPVITPNITGTQGNDGWYRSDVIVTWSVVDAETEVSGPVGCGPTTINADTPGTELACSASSLGGSSIASVTIKRDATAPVIALSSRLPAANDDGWNGSDVTVGWTCSDALSGVVNANDSKTVSAEGQHQSATGACTDQAGNTSQHAATGISIDKTAPALTPSVSPNPVLVGGSATASPGATDPLSGVASASCGTVTTSTVGSFSVGCTATDRAGNAAATEQASYQVTYSFPGFAAPVDNNGTLNVAKAGKAIALKWRLVDGNGSPVATLASVNLTVENYQCGLVQTADAIEEYSAGSSGLQNLGNGYYQYNWKAPASYANSCKTLMLDLGDGTPRTALFKFTR